MKDKESIFKEIVKNQLVSQLVKIGYEKEEEWKGFLKYRCQNNYLKIVYEWNRTYSYYCEIGFNTKENYEFFLGNLLLKLDSNIKEWIPIFNDERTFTKKISDWINELSNQIKKYNIEGIGFNHPKVAELVKEYLEEQEEANKKYQITETKENADKAWKNKDYKYYIQIMKNKSVDLPPSYTKRLSIAEKKIKNENGA